MQVSLEKDGAILRINENGISIVQGFAEISLQIPIFAFKASLFKAFTGNSPQVYGNFDSKITIVKVRAKYEKILLKLSNEEDHLLFSIYHNELAGLSMKLRHLHSEPEETLICGDQLTLKRVNGKVIVEDKRIPFSTELSEEERDFLFGTVLLRLYGIKADGIFGDIALQGNTLKFPFVSLGKKGRTLHPFTAEDAAKFLAVL
jgi:hypothetical protein